MDEELTTAINKAIEAIRDVDALTADPRLSDLCGECEDRLHEFLVEEGGEDDDAETD